MDNLLKFPISNAEIVYSLVKKGNDFEETDQMLSIKFYKEALIFLLDQRKIQGTEIRCLMRTNHVLVAKLKLAHKKIERQVELLSVENKATS